LRRQTTTSRVAPAGSSRDERLGPFCLPLHFEPADPAGDERVRLVELHQERVVLRRAARGIKLALNLPVATYLGVAIRMEPPAGTAAGVVTLVLEHADPALSLILYRGVDGTDIVAEWRAWGRALSVPLLVADADGRLREPFDRIGGVRVGPPAARRRRHLALRRRRPALPLRRRVGTLPATLLVHRSSCDVIARN
jgi:Family of unknown function (DUF6101)